MPDQDQTINEETAPSAVQTDGELIDTIDEPIVPSLEEAQKTDEVAKEEEAKAKGKEEPKEPRFDKHPRFQELITSQRNSKKEIADLKTQIAEKAKSKEPEFKDITGLTEEEIQDWVDTDPKGYQANLVKQIEANVTEKITSKLDQSTAEERVLKTYNAYSANNNTFDPMWESGEIQSFMDSNPGHNAMSAHMAMTTEGRIKEAVEAAQQETEERVIKNFKAKKNAQVLGDGPTSTGTAHDKIAPELKDPKKYGGVNTVLAARLAERRKAG